MPPKGKEPPPPAEPEVPARPLSEEEKRTLFLKKIPELRAAGDGPHLKQLIEGMAQFVSASGEFAERNAQIQVIACRHINKLATVKDGSANEKRDLLRKAGGLEQIIKTIDAHGALQELYKEAFEALCHLAHTQNSTHKQTFGDSGGVERIVAGMHSHAGNADLQRFACAALHNLADVSLNSEKIAEKGGIERIIAALEVHADPSIQLDGCGALQILSIQAGNRGRIVASGGIERILAAMTKHPKNVKLAEYCCGVLLNVGCATAQMKPKLIESRSVQSIRSLLQRVVHEPEASANTKAYGKMILDAL